ncbi:homoserine kinase [Salsuginibacillus halophilus]|uniref:Homoserine kinase n=1 Tax=Salsuginibacillus halophilus TaxID=517424 RepID=A0A2P8HE34_9BACI|nr:homoserine kinase [Salsuginibacillus halophilus]PSL44455.1 homoserine kinase [Salsuginibacillus halophilus]
MKAQALRISVPASSANLGPGFDSIGLAVDRYLTLDVTQAAEWSFTTSSPVLEGVPEGKNNVIFEIAAHIAKKMNRDLPPCHVHMSSDIPLARGLGSSAAATIAAIELADQLMGTELSQDDKMRFASLWEGHPDNVGPCLFGGLIVGTHSPDATDIVHLGVPDVEMVMLVPDERLMTKEARGILPRQLEYHQAIKGSSISNVLVAAIMSGDWELAGRMMRRDVFHHPYRAELLPGLTEMLKGMNEYGAYGAALSGAGPTVLCFVPKGEGERIREALAADYPHFDVQLAQPAPRGVQVYTFKESEQVNAAL